MNTRNPIARQLLPGHFIHVDESDCADHTIGGPQQIEGAWCPNCDKPLMVHFRLATSDPCLGLKDFPVSSIPLLYCGRCALSWHDFVYRITGNQSIEIVAVNRGEVTWEDWVRDVGVDVFPQRSCRLIPIPERLQDLCTKLNAAEDLLPDEVSEFSRYTGIYADQQVGGYAYVDVFNQIGGRSFLCQRLSDPRCPICPDAKAFFLASLTNDKRQNLKLSYDGVQIVFFFCPECLSIVAVHST